MGDQLDELESRLTDDQPSGLDMILEHYQEHKGTQWIHARLLRRRFSKSSVRVALKQLGGSVVSERGYGPDACYELTLLGILLTSQGRAAEELLVRYLEYVRGRFSSDPELAQVKRADVDAALGLTVEQSGFLKQLVSLGGFWAVSASFGDDWYAGLPSDVEDFQAVDLRSYVRQRAVQGYDPDLPVEETERGNYRNQQQAQERRSEFWFVRNSELQRLLDEDWQEALNVCNQARAWKSCVILCGGILEGMLMDALGRDEQQAREVCRRTKPKASLGNPDQWSLGELVDTASEMGILGKSDVHLGHALREYRNLIHPGRQLRRRVVVTEQEATIALSAVRIWLQALAARSCAGTGVA